MMQYKYPTRTDVSFLGLVDVIRLQERYPRMDRLETGGSVRFQYMVDRCDSLLLCRDHQNFRAYRVVGETLQTVLTCLLIHFF